MAGKIRITGEPTAVPSFGAIQAVASDWVALAPTRLAICTTKYSKPSAVLSSITGTKIVRVVSPGANTTDPPLGAKSLPEVVPPVPVAADQVRDTTSTDGRSRLMTNAARPVFSSTTVSEMETSGVPEAPSLAAMLINASELPSTALVGVCR